VSAFQADVVVMTQACDLEHDKVRNVVLCPHVALSTFRSLWERALQQGGQNPTAKAWRKPVATSRTATSGTTPC
jgi:hypothetical protein